MDEIAGAASAGTVTTTSLALTRTSQATTTVTLLRPPVVVPVSSFAYVAQMPPIGLAYVAGALRDAGHDVHVVDAPGTEPEQVTLFSTPLGEMYRIGLTFDEILARIPAETTVVGITHMFLHEWPTVRELAEAVKRSRPDVFVVLGGENATSYRQWIFEETTAVDACVLGEGEATAVELMGRLAAGAPLTDMEGIALRAAEVGTAARDGVLPVRIRAMDTLPRPAWDLFPMDGYFRFHDAIGMTKSRSIPMLATRGCPYKCSFCSSPQMWTTRYTVREPKDIVDELEDYVERYGIDNIDFVDLTAMTKRKWTLALCDELEERGLGTLWHLPVGTRSEGFDAHLLRRLYAGGCRSVTFAPEHGSQRMLDVYDKRVDLDHIYTSIKDARKAGLVTHVNTVIGHPAERTSDRWVNLLFLMRVAFAGCDTGSAFIFHPYPGSRDFREAVEAGRLTAGDDYVYDGLANGLPGNRSWNPEMSAKALYRWQLAMKAGFEAAAVVRDPRRAWRIARAMVARDEHRPAEEGKEAGATGPVGMRLGDEHDVRLVALWVRSQLRGRAHRARHPEPTAPVDGPPSRQPVPSG